MDSGWLTVEQFAKIQPHLLNDARGSERFDDQWLISGIVQVLDIGFRWPHAPSEVYGPNEMLSNRFVHWG